MVSGGGTPYIGDQRERCSLRLVVSREGTYTLVVNGEGPPYADDQ